MTKKLKSALKEQKKSTKKESLRISGTLGIPIGGQRRVEVPQRKSFVYVKLRDNQNEIIQAYNNKVAASYGLPVVVERQGGRYVILEVDTLRYQNNLSSFSPYLPRHGNTHSFDLESGGGGDVVWVHSRQMMPTLVMPSGTLGGPNVVVGPHVLKNPNGGWKYVGNTGTANITSYKSPTGTQASLVLVYLDALSGNPKLLVGSGTYFHASITGTQQIIPYIPSVTDANQIPLAAVRLVSGTSVIGWDNIYDLRQWMYTPTTGTAVGGTVSVYDEGVFAGTVANLNFVGDNVSATVSGNTARIFVTGSIGGSSTGTSVGVWDEGVNKGTVSTFDFVGTPVDISVSGTVARVFITGSSGSGIANLTGTSIGLPNKIALTNSSGFLNTHPGLAWGVQGSNPFIEFGANVVGKVSNAGYVGYQIFSNGYLEFIGAGTGSGDRWSRFYDNVKVNELFQTNGFQVLNLSNSWAYLNATGTAVGPINAPEETVITGTHRILGMNGSFNSVQFSVNDLAEGIVYTDVIGTYLEGDVVTATGTFGASPFRTGASSATSNVPWPEGGQLFGMYLRTSTSQPASGSLVVTLLINNVASSLTITVPAGSGNGTFSNVTNRVAITSGDLLRWSIQNNATANSAALTSLTMSLHKRATA